MTCQKDGRKEKLHIKKQWTYLTDKKRVLCVSVIIFINIVTCFVGYQLGKQSQKYISNYELTHRIIKENENLVEGRYKSDCPSYIVRMYSTCIDSERLVFVPMLDIAYMPDGELWEKVTANMRNCFVEWMPVSVFNNAVSDGSYIMLDTNKYLSIENGYKIDVPDYITYLYICNTLDMQTGEVLYLDDFIQVDMGFVNAIMQEGIAKLDIPGGISGEETYYTAEMLEWVKKESVLANLKECSVPYNEDNYSGKPTFYLRENRLYLKYVFSDQSEIYVELDDIEEYLIVEKW